MKRRDGASDSEDDRNDGMTRMDEPKPFFLFLSSLWASFHDICDRCHRVRSIRACLHPPSKLYASGDFSARSAEYDYYKVR